MLDTSHRDEGVWACRASQEGRRRHRRRIGHRAGAGDRTGPFGRQLAISDVDTEGLAVTEERIKAIGAPVKADRLDVTEREAFSSTPTRSDDHFGKVNQIYNNAGIAYVGTSRSARSKTSNG